MGISIDEAVRNQLISSECASILPKKCNCGADLELSDSLRWLYCTSNNCRYNLLKKINKLCDKIDISISDKDINKLIDKLNLISHYQILMLNDNIKNHIADIDINTDKLSEFRNRAFYIYEIAELCCDETIEKIAKTLFYGFNSFDEAYNEIDEGQVSFIDERIGVSNTDSMTLSYSIYESLLSLREEFIFIESQLKIRKFNDRLKIAFADNTLPFINKTEFIDFLNFKYKYIFCTVSTIKDDTDILVSNSGVDSNKNKIASLINNKYIAEKMNNGEMTLSDINKLDNEHLKPLGSTVYVTNIESLLNHLDELEEHRENE